MGQICSFCGSKDEAQKSSAFADTTSSSSIADAHHPQQHPLSSNPYGQAPEGSSALDRTPNSPSHEHDRLLQGSDHPSHGLEQVDENERQRRLAQYRMEQAELARREAIVTAASQSMVPVGGSHPSPGGVGGGVGVMNHHRGGGGIYTYYDPAYAAAAAQDILNSAARSGGLTFADDQATRAAWNASVMGVMPVPPRDGSLSTSKDIMETLGRGRWDGIQLGSRGSGVAGCGGEDPEYYLDDLAEAFLESMVPTKTTLFGGCPSIVENLP